MRETDEGLPPEARARMRRERMEEVASYVQTGLGVVAVLAGLGLAIPVVRAPNMIGAVLVGGIFVVGIVVAVPAARPWIIRIVERLPGMKDLPDDGAVDGRGA